MLDFLVELSRWYNLLFALPVFIVVIYQFLHTLAALDVGSVDTAFGDLGAIATDKLSQSTSSFFLRCFLNHAFLSNPRFNLLNSSAIFIITFGFNLFLGFNLLRFKYKLGSSRPRAAGR